MCIAVDGIFEGERHIISLIIAEVVISPLIGSCVQSVRHGIEVSVGSILRIVSLIVHKLVQILSSVINKARMRAVVVRAIDHVFSATLTKIETIND